MSYVLARYAMAVYPDEPVPLRRTIGENIRAARIAGGFQTQGALAQRMGVPQPQLADWENDRYKAPDVKTLLKIAASIPCDLGALVHGVDPAFDASRDLLRHSSIEGSAPGGADDPASARVLDLEHRIKAQEALIRDVQDVARKLFAIAVGPEGEKAARPQAKRGRTTRKIS